MRKPWQIRELLVLLGVRSGDVCCNGQEDAWFPRSRRGRGSVPLRGLLGTTAFALGDCVITRERTGRWKAVVLLQAVTTRYPAGYLFCRTETEMLSGSYLSQVSKLGIPELPF